MRQQRRMVIGAPVILLVLFAWLAGTARADGVVGYAQQTASTSVGPGGTADVTAFCTSGKVVTGGGVDAGGTDDVKIYSSEPTNGASTLSDNSWNASVRNDGTVAHNVTVTAVCVDGSVAGYEEPTTPASVTAGAVPDVTTSCSSGHKVLGGGFRLETPDDLKPFSSQPTQSSNLSDHVWHMLVHNAGTVTRTMTLYAICVADTISGYEEPTNLVSVPAGTTADVTASCSPGHVVVGGGFQIETPTAVSVRSFAPGAGDGVPSDHQWNVFAINEDQSSARQTTSYAICAAPAVPGIATAVSQATIGLGDSFSDTATLTVPTGAPVTNGSVTFNVYAADDPNCAGSPVFSSGKALDGSTVATSDPFTPASQGTYQVIASYSGDSNYQPTQTACGDPGEQVSVGPAVPSLSTSVSSAEIPLGATFHDTATLPSDAGGSVTFDVFGPASSECSGSPLYNSTNPVASGTATSDDFPGAASGDYEVIANYSGDANYAPTSTGCFDDGESVFVDQATPTLTTALSQSQITLGDSFTDTVSLDAVPPGATPPTGSVRFDVFGPGDPECVGPAVFSSTIAIDTSGQATSDAFMPTGTGTYRVTASYSGDGNYAAAGSPCLDPGEPVSVVAATPTIATQVSVATVPFGGSFSDTATITPPAGEPAPTGTVEFDVFGPNDPSACTAPAVFASTKLVGATGAATSDAFTPTVPGTYQVVATYAGDANYNPASTDCADATESVVVGKVALSVSTQVTPPAIGLGASFHDTATLGTPPAGPPAPTGTVTFDVYDPSDLTCAGTPDFNSTDPVAVAGTTSADFTPTATGTYRVIARYSGDANYSPVATACGDAAEQVAVAQASLPLTTQVAPAQVTLGGSFHDTATLGSPPAGAATPTGSVTYRVYADATCATQVFSSTNPLGATSDTFTPSAAGTYRVVAVYSGDANYNPASTACGDAGETLTVGKATLPLITQVASAAITLGGSFSDTATLGSPSVLPTGSVTFRVYADAACATQVFGSTNPLTGATAASDSFTPTAAGTYRVVAAYPGDANYKASSTACGDAGETVTVGKATLPLTTQVAPAAITLGGSFHDTARLGSPSVPPAGSVTFRVYSDINCTTQVSSSTNPVSGATAVSDGFTPSARGTYRVVASYGGDANYNASASACGDAGEQAAVAKATVAVATAAAPASIPLGASFHDTATLTGAPAGAAPPTGGVTFTVYADAACTKETVSSTNPVTGATAVSGDFTPTAAGTYRVVASYGGDANYNSSSSACGDAGETVTVDRASLALTTQVAPAAIALGASFHDIATLGAPPAGAAQPTGTVRFDVYGPADANCGSMPAFSSTNPVGAPSDTFTPTAAGTYRVVASYSGDASYTPSAAGCGDPGETVTVAKAAIAIATQVSPASAAEGSAFHDTATLGPTAGPAPTGTVTFRVYSDASCTTQVLTSTNAVGTPSDDFAPDPGTYRVVASYGGDANYAAATSACGDPAETVVVVQRPAITRINPRSGPEAGGNTVAITGSDFTGASSVHFGAATVNFTLDSPTRITATAPPGSGTVDVTVTTPGGTSAPAQYTYNASLPPVVTGVAPSSGSTDGGSGVIVTGSNLGGATAVNFGALAGRVLSVNPAGTRLVAITPPSTPGTVDVTVTTPFGTSPTTTADRYTYVVPPPPPTVTGLNPSTGSAGTTVTIGGTSLTGATAVKFGALGATGFTVLSPSQISATAPTGSGAVDVSVTTPGGTSATGAADTFTYVAPPAAPGPAGSTTGGVVVPPRQPTAQTGAPKVIDSSTEEFTATINPQGLPTTMHFEYTAATGGAANLAAISYAARTPEQVVGSDFADHTVTARVAGLVPNSDYHVRAVATNSGGTTASGDTAFTSATDPPPPPPVLGTAFNAEPVSGTVYVLLPGRGHVSQAHVSAAKGVGFIPLTEARQLPVGTIFDTTAGTARLTTATARKGVTQSGSFASGLFKLLQNRKQKGLTELSLVLRPSAVRKCSTATKVQAQSAAKKALPKTVLTLLRATAKGRFQTRGRYSSATVRGTSWTTSDRCDGTLTHVTRGVVVVTNTRRHRQIVLRAGKSYLAAKP